MAYTGELLLAFYSTCGHIIPFSRGESLVQLISIPQVRVNWNKLENDPNLNVRGGFGSTNV